MRCPYCGNPDQRVLDSRPTPDGESIRRRRECPACGKRFSTVERAERIRLQVVKRGGGREEFDREKLLKSMRIAARKRPVASERLEIAAESIERALIAEGHDEIPTDEIGLRVMRELSTIDTVAYVRFASVYQEFTTITDFASLVDRVAREEAEIRFSHLQESLL